MKRIYYLPIALCIFALIQTKEISKSAKETVKPEKISEEIEKKNKAAQDARERAEKALEEAKKAEEMAYKYKSLSEEYKGKDSNLYESMLKLQEEYSNNAKKQFDIQIKEENNVSTLEKEVASLTELQNEANALQSSFNESKEHESPIGEAFESCIDKLFEKQQKGSQFDNDEYKKLLQQFSDRVRELEIYERSTFYNSSQITDDQWNKIHDDALNDKGKYDLKYKKLLQAIEQIKQSIKDLFKQKNDFAFSSSDIYECFKKNYPVLEQKLINIEKKISEEAGDESSPWG